MLANLIKRWFRQLPMRLFDVVPSERRVACSTGAEAGEATLRTAAPAAVGPADPTQLGVLRAGARRVDPAAALPATVLDALPTLLGAIFAAQYH